MKLSSLIRDLQAILDANGDLDVVSLEGRKYDPNRGFFNCSDDILWHTDGTIGIDITDTKTYCDNGGS